MRNPTERGLVPSFTKLLLPLSIGLIVSATVSAQETTKTPMEAMEEVVTVGSRTPGRTVTESLVPVDVINQEAILNSGAIDTADMLRKLAPSFNMNNTTTSDGQDLMRPATLRSMGADQVLVLINGKRRHQQAVVAVQENVGRGSAGTDLSAIPLTAIARVEILRDGAAAQYGSDAIAGVINIILKDEEGGTGWAQYRTTKQKDGDQKKVGLHYGMEIGDGGHLNLTYEYVDQDSLNRASESNWGGAYPHTPKQLILVGEGELKSDAFWVNASLPVGDGELYAFGGFTKKKGSSLGFYRGPADGRVWSVQFPDGVTPGLGTQTEDTSIALGYKTDLGNWEADASVTLGENRFEFRNTESLNASYGPTGPTTAYDGALVNDQMAVNVDAFRALDVSFVDGMTLALGAEYRRDGYKQEAGDAVSYDRGSVLCDETVNPTGDPAAVCAAVNNTVPGMQGFQGYSPAMVIDASRNSYAFYVDTELDVNDVLDVGAALRYENYDDFGDAINGKLSARIELTETLALRGAVSTGFRAPGMQQKYFTQRSISLSAGQLTDLVTLRPDSALAQDFGFSKLKEEKSLSASVGFVYTGESFTSTLDIYRVEIKDRIVLSGNVTYEAGNAAVDAVFNANNSAGQALDGVKNVSIFTNAADTTTDGLDWVNTWDIDAGNGDVVLEAAFHYNNTTVDKVNEASSLVSSSVIYDESQKLLLTNGQPGIRGILSATYNLDNWSVTGRANHYGEVSSASYGTDRKTWSAKTLYDITALIDLTDSVQISAGVLNVADTYPDEWGSESLGFNTYGFKYGWTTFPFSLAGREYYVKAAYNF